MSQPKAYQVHLEYPAPYDYPSRTIDVSAGPGYDRAHVSVAYDDCHSATRLYIRPEDARALALKLLGAAMDAEHIEAQRAAGVRV